MFLGFIKKICDMNWINPLSTIPTKWSNTLMQRNCLSVLDHFVGLAFQGLSRPGGGERKGTTITEKTFERKIISFLIVLMENYIDFHFLYHF